MAFLMKSSPRSTIVPVLWNVSTAVGVNGTNGLEDTWLVQYMLNMSAKSAHAMDAGMRAKLLALQVTGICDPYTIDCIKAYQTYIKAKNSTVVVDGRITSAPPGLKYGTAYYMIAMVNMTYRDRYWDNWPVICADSSYADSVITELVYRELFGTLPPK
ncbi:MAG: hypothetical protein ACREUE_18830 [Panacagrimonas sp.]